MGMFAICRGTALQYSLSRTLLFIIQLITKVIDCSYLY